MDEPVDAVRAIMANPRFQTLVATRRRLAWTLTAIMLITYFTFILLVAFNKTDGHIISAKVGSGTASLAIVLGFSLLVFTFILTAIYVVIANTKFDAMAAELRREVGR